MSLFDGIHSLADTLIFRERPPCKACLDADRGTHRMEATRTYHPKLAAHVDAWECPNCDRAVVRGDDPEIINADGKRL